MALQEIRLTRGATLELDPFPQTAPDDSLKAIALKRAGKPIPTWKIENASPELRAFFVIHRDRCTVLSDPGRWNQLLDRWSEELERWQIQTPPSLDGLWHIDAEHLPVLRLQSNQGRSGARTRWWALQPASACYNLRIGEGTGFHGALSE